MREIPYQQWPGYVPHLGLSSGDHVERHSKKAEAKWTSSTSSDFVSLMTPYFPEYGRVDCSTKRGRCWFPKTLDPCSSIQSWASTIYVLSLSHRWNSNLKCVFPLPVYLRQKTQGWCPIKRHWMNNLSAFGNLGEPHTHTSLTPPQT